MSPLDLPALTHVTDVASRHRKQGTDSAKRIITQYERAGRRVQVINPGRTPLDVAFFDATIVNGIASQRADTVRKLLDLPEIPRVPVALNAAPRNRKESANNGKEDYIYVVTLPSGDQKILYGPELLSWLLFFHKSSTRASSNDPGISIQRVRSIGTNRARNNIIADTSCGSQFRSAEHLPLAHTILDRGRLGDLAKSEEASADEFCPPTLASDECIVLPSDEFDNGRILVRSTLARKLAKRGEATLLGIEAEVRNSLTNVTPGTIALWPSSNHLPDTNLAVLNLWTRWDEGGYASSNPELAHLKQRLGKLLGTHQKIT